MTGIKRFLQSPDKLFVRSASTIKEAMVIISKGEERTCLLVDNARRLRRVISDGDVRRALINGASMDDQVASIHQRLPVTLNIEESLEAAELLFDRRISLLPVLDQARKVVGYIRKQDLVTGTDIRNRKIGIIGLGYVGLTLGLSMAESGFLVYGFDKDPNVTRSLIKKKSLFFEKGISQYLETYVGENFRPLGDVADFRADVYILTVGTPFDREAGRPETQYIIDAATSVGKIIKNNDLVILRSTVPIGCTRETVIPILEKNSGLEAGSDFSVAYCPERTAEGRALEELRTLPQIVGGFDSRSRELAQRIFTENTHTVIDIGSLEAAEACKLLDNSYRDIRFAFSNQLAQLSEELGLDLRHLIQKVNLGYERNAIPEPSPGVGGACLTKDPYILASCFEDHGLSGELFKLGRQINERGPIRIVEQSVSAFAQLGKRLEKAKIFIVGFAFKGSPETSDLRGSTTLSLLTRLQEIGVENICGYDPIVERAAIEAYGVSVCDVTEGFNLADAVFIMNNHSSYRSINMYPLLASMRHPALFFDSWQMFSGNDVTSFPGIVYKSVGRS